MTLKDWKKEILPSGRIRYDHLIDTFAVVLIYQEYGCWWLTGTLIKSDKFKTQQQAIIEAEKYMEAY